MGAILDRTKRSYFLLEAPRNGVMFARALGMFLTDEVKPHQVSNSQAAPQNPKYPWAVCPHVSNPESLMDCYSNAGFILILLGKCLCQDCHEQILINRDLHGFLNSCQHMSDVELQQNFIDPLIRANRNASEASRPPWACCSHIAQQSLLEKLYQGCKPIFIHAGQVACNECMDAVPLAGSPLPDYTPMNDDLFQQRVVDQLYPLNLKMLQAIRHRQ